MTKRKSESEEKCPHCGCPELSTFARDRGVYTSCNRCGKIIPPPAPPVEALAERGRLRMPTFSLRKLRDVQWRLEQVWRGERGLEGPAFVHPFTDEQLAIMSHAIGVLAAERLAAGERLTEADDETSRAEAATWPKASTGHAVLRAGSRTIELGSFVERYPGYAGVVEGPAMTREAFEAARRLRSTIDHANRLAESLEAAGAAATSSWPKPSGEIRPSKLVELLELFYCATCGTLGAATPSSSGVLCSNCHSSGVWRASTVLEQLVAAGVVRPRPDDDDDEAVRVPDPEGDDPISLWIEWWNDGTYPDDSGGTFADRVHAMLERRGVKP